MLRPGDAAPDFVLKDIQGKDTRLSSFGERPIVLLFIKKAKGRMCSMELQSVGQVHHEITGMGAVVVGVTMRSDSDMVSPFPLLEDPDGRIYDLYDAWRTSLIGRRPQAAKRCSYLIDEDGIIRKTYGRINVMRHGKELVKDLRRLKAQRSWGKKDARPKDLVP